MPEPTTNAGPDGGAPGVAASGPAPLPGVAASGPAPLPGVAPAFDAYLGGPPAALDTVDAPRPPAWVSMPVRERVRALATGVLDAAEWLRVADDWARQADTRYRGAVDLRPSPAPIRVGVKDTVDVAGYATRLGLPHYRHHPRRTAAALDALSTPLAGAVAAAVNAKVVTTELNIGLRPGCVNPYFPHIDPAGSSTGSGVCVAAGICDLSLGTDVLGSARWPAGRCGVVGLRVTHDPARLAGIFPLSPSMDAPGWIARTVDDLRFLWPLTGLGTLPEQPAPRRVGLVQEVLDDDLDPQVAAALDVTAERLRAAGHSVVPVRLGSAWLFRGLAWELCAREAWDGFQRWQRHIADDLSEPTRLALEVGRDVPDHRYGQIQAAQARARGELSAWFAASAVDAWLLPLDPDLPRHRDAPPPEKTIPSSGQDDYDRDIGYTPLASFLGLPAITVPVGRSTQDAPLAMQLIGPRHGEGVIVALAHDLATAAGDLGLAPR